MIWYVEPLTVETNALLAAELPEENSVKDAHCEDGKSRDLWKCAHSLITKLKTNKRSLGIRFNIFNQEKDHAPIRKWKFI